MKQTKSTQAGKKVSPSTGSSKKFKVKITDNFYNEAKELQKKYPRIKEDFMALKDDLKSDPESLGEPLPSEPPIPAPLENNGETQDKNTLSSKSYERKSEETSQS